MHWITRHRLKFHVHCPPGQPATQDDPVKPGFVCRDVISALHERSHRVVTGYHLICRLDVRDVAARLGTEFRDKIGLLPNKNLSSKLAVDVASNETLHDRLPRSDSDPLREGQVHALSATARLSGGLARTLAANTTLETSSVATTAIAVLRRAPYA